MAERCEETRRSGSWRRSIAGAFTFAIAVSFKNKQSSREGRIIAYDRKIRR
jgi:hypothetical protein